MNKVLGEYQPDLVSTGDIAHIAGISINAVTNWKARYSKSNRSENPNDMPPFPKPVVRTGAGPLYDRREVLEWLQARTEAQQ